MTDTWLSVITVVKDDSSGFARTLESISKQDLSGVELCVIDSSTDSMVIQETLTSAQYISFSYEWVEPAGIYPAMNIGVARATGDYLYFLNAGDVFSSSDVLEQLQASVGDTSPPWLFGPVRIVSLDGSSVTTPAWDYSAEKASLFSRGLFPPHQGTVVRRSLFEQINGFDTSYRIAADYAAFLRLSQIAEPLIVDYVVAEFFEGGVSSMKWRESFREFHRARRAILKPTGSAALREQINTRVHFTKVFAYKELVLRARR